ncbi:MAG: GNAT family N-acetyltransferase [Pseudomonadota bacterium]|nr:GNAT family N-acetyltransferase [Pseudomonadota bacterium]
MDAALHFHIQTELAADELALLWRDLETRADVTFFLSWDWIGAWIAELGIKPTVLIGEAGGAMVLLGIVVPRRRREAGVIRVDGLYLHATGRRETDVIAHEYNGFLVARDWRGRAEAAAAGFLLGCQIGRGRFDELHIVAMLDRDQALLTPPGALVQVPFRKPSWRVDLEAVRASGRPYLEQLSANTRQQIRRSMRLYEERGPLLAARAEDAPTALAWLDELKSLHQAHWQARGEPGGFAFPFFERFQQRLIANCVPRGTVEMLRVTAGDETIGYVYNLMWRGHVLAYVTGFRAEQDGRLKPGLVGHTLAIERHVQEGARLYDFMAGEYRYKTNLGQEGPEFVYLLLQRATPTTRMEQTLRRGRDRVRALTRRRRPDG